MVSERGNDAERRRQVEIDAVAAANREFYDNVESGDLEAVLDAWEHSRRVQCTHPGWSVIRGWDEVGGSWAAILQSNHVPQFLLTNEHVEVQGDLAWVTVDENLLGQNSVTVSALNLFARHGDVWKMIAHHASVVSSG